MIEIVFQLFILAVIVSILIYILSWKVFFKIGNKLIKAINKIEEENRREK